MPACVWGALPPCNTTAATATSRSRPRDERVVPRKRGMTISSITPAGCAAQASLLRPGHRLTRDRIPAGGPRRQAAVQDQDVRVAEEAQRLEGRVDLLHRAVAVEDDQPVLGQLAEALDRLVERDRLRTRNVAGVERGRRP